MIKLSEISEINYGYSFREKITNNPDGNVYVVQPKCITNTAKLLMAGIECVTIDNLKKRLLLMQDDVLLINKGRFAATVFEVAGFSKYVASSGLFVLRVKNKQYLPLFIVMYLNSYQGKKALNKVGASTTIPSISIDAVGEIKIPDITLKYQQEVVSLWQNFSCYKALINKKIALEEKIINHTINKLLSKKEK